MVCTVPDVNKVYYLGVTKSSFVIKRWFLTIGNEIAVINGPTPTSAAIQWAMMLSRINYILILKIMKNVLKRLIRCNQYVLCP
jgi:hypothetical protein